MKKPDPELSDDENPEWTEEMFAKAVPFSALPPALQAMLSESKQVKPDPEPDSEKQPAA